TVADSRTDRTGTRGEPSWPQAAGAADPADGESTNRQSVVARVVVARATRRLARAARRLDRVRLFADPRQVRRIAVDDRRRHDLRQLVPMLRADVIGERGIPAAFGLECHRPFGGVPDLARPPIDAVDGGADLRARGQPCDNG